MTNIERNRICWNAIEHYGKELQLGLVQEECAELIQAISKYKRNKSNKHLLNVIEEIADVKIMLVQLGYMINIGQYEINDAMDYKLNRLQQRIKEDK